MGGNKKPIQRGNCLKKGGLGQFTDLRGRVGKKEWEGGVFEGGVIP